MELRTSHAQSNAEPLQRYEVQHSRTTGSTLEPLARQQRALVASPLASTLYNPECMFACRQVTDPPLAAAESETSAHRRRWQRDPVKLFNTDVTLRHRNGASVAPDVPTWAACDSTRSPPLRTSRLGQRASS